MQLRVVLQCMPTNIANYRARNTLNCGKVVRHLLPRNARALGVKNNVPVAIVRTVPMSSAKSVRGASLECRTEQTQDIRTEQTRPAHHQRWGPGEDFMNMMCKTFCPALSDLFFDFFDL